MTLGFQQYSLKEFEGAYDSAFEAVKAMGIDHIEPWCGAVPGNEGESASLNELRRFLTERAMKLTCGHITPDEFDSRYDLWRDLLKDFGSHTWVIPFAKADNLEDWLAMLPKFEEMADRLKSDGLNLAYHNHHMELVKMGEKYVMEHLLDGMPELQAQFHIAQFLPDRGISLPDWINKYKGRICALHVNDANEKGSAPLGKGSCRAEESVKTALDCGVDTYILEINLTMATLDGVKRDVETLQEWLGL